MNKKIWSAAAFSLGLLFFLSCFAGSGYAVNYADGVYEGIGVGYGRGLKVAVTLKKGLMSNIQILSHNERGPQYYEKALRLIPKAILQKQSVDVDAISGATMTSNGIKEAVRKALDKAAVKK